MKTVWRLTEIQGTHPAYYGLDEARLWFASREEAVKATEAMLDVIAPRRGGCAWKARRRRTSYRIVECVGEVE